VLTICELTDVYPDGSVDYHEVDTIDCEGCDAVDIIYEAIADATTL
jgi:hypothetical protein